VSERVRDYVVKYLEEQNCRGIRVTDSNVQCSCPLHDARFNRNSFSIKWDDENGIYPFQCFSCKERGTLVTLVAKLNKISVKDAFGFVSKFVPLEDSTIDAIIREWNRIVRHKEKEFTEDDMPPRFRFGDAMVCYMKDRRRFNYSLLYVNYIIHKYQLYYCNEGEYRGRIIMPIYECGKLKGFNNRSVFDTGLKCLYKKGLKMADLLYGYDEAETDKVVVVEGAFDLYQVECAIRKVPELRGFCVVALMSSTMNESRVSKLFTKFSEATLLFDKGDAGDDVTMKASGMLRPYMKVSVANRNHLEGDDPGSSSEYGIARAIQNAYSGRTVLDQLKSACRV